MSAESEERYRLVFEMAPNPVIVRRRERIVFANPAAVRFFGARGAEDLAGRNLLTLIHPDERDEAARRISMIEERGGVTPAVERRFLRIDGREVIGETSGSEVTYGGERMAIMAIYDVTGRKRAEQARVESERRYRTLFETCPLPMLVRHRDTFRFLAVNEAAVRFYGYSREAFLGMSTLDIRPADERERYVNDWRVLDQNLTHTIVRKHLTRDGRIVEVEVTASPFVYDGSPATLAVINDVTERMRHQSEIERLNTELDRRVAERTAQLQETNKELEAFSYSVSHDLRAPLRGIDGFSQALLEDYAGRLDDQGREFLNRIHACSRRMAELIEDLLALSRVTRAEMRRGSVDLSAIAREIAAELQKTQPERTVAFDIALDLMVEGDRNLLRTMLENLLGNAWKFSGKRPEAKIQLGIVRQDGATVYFVRDNGAGFDMAYAGKLFGAFQRLHGATEFPGTGIGLATVQRIVRRHRGKVWAQGAVDEGATFYFTLP